MYEVNKNIFKPVYSEEEDNNGFNYNYNMNNNNNLNDNSSTNSLSSSSFSSSTTANNNNNNNSGAFFIKNLLYLIINFAIRRIKSINSEIVKKSIHVIYSIVYRAHWIGNV